MQCSDMPELVNRIVYGEGSGVTFAAAEAKGMFTLAKALLLMSAAALMTARSAGLLIDRS